MFCVYVCVCVCVCVRVFVWERERESARAREKERGRENGVMGVREKERKGRGKREKGTRSLGCHPFGTLDHTCQYTATYCIILQHTATHCNILHHTATHCYTLQRTHLSRDHTCVFLLWVQNSSYTLFYEGMIILIVHTHMHWSSVWAHLLLQRTGCPRPIECLIFIGHSPRKIPIISGSFAETNLQLKASYGSSPLCNVHRVLLFYVCTHVWIDPLYVHMSLCRVVCVENWYRTTIFMQST